MYGVQEMTVLTVTPSTVIGISYMVQSLTIDYMPQMHLPLMILATYLFCNSFNTIQVNLTFVEWPGPVYYL